MGIARRRPAMRLAVASFTILLVVIPGWTGADPVGPVEVRDSAGFVEVVGEPLVMAPGNRFVAVADVYLGTASAFGYLQYSTSNPSAMYGGIVASRDGAWDLASVRVNDVEIGVEATGSASASGLEHFSHTFSWPSRVGIVFFGVGEVRGLSVRVMEGRVLNSSQGSGAQIIRAEDLTGGEVESTLLTVMAQTEQRVNFQTSGPFYGAIDYTGLPTSAAQKTTLEGPGQTYSCPCWLNPTTTTGGSHTLTVSGAGYSGIIGWIVEPSLPEV